MLIAIKEVGRGSVMRILVAADDRGVLAAYKAAFTSLSNTIGAMGRSLSLESDGPGKGARAIILLLERQTVAGDEVNAATLAA